MKKETLSFAAFLSLNGFLSVNCLVYGMTKDSTRPQVTVEVSQEKKLNQLKSARVSALYPFPAPHRYLSDTKKQEVYVKKGAADAVYISAARNDKVIFYEYSTKTKFIVKKTDEFPKSDLDRKLKGTYKKAILLSSFFDSSYYAAVPSESDLDHSYFLRWDEYAKKEKTELGPLISRTVLPAGGFLLDIITFPIQFVVGWTIGLLYMFFRK